MAKERCFMGKMERKRFWAGIPEFGIQMVEGTAGKGRMKNIGVVLVEKEQN